MQVNVDASKIIDTIADVIGEKTKKGMLNAGDLTLTQIAGALSSKCEKGEIGVNELMETISGLSYTKDLTKYLGRTKKVKFSYDRKCD